MSQENLVEDDIKSQSNSDNNPVGSTEVNHSKFPNDLTQHSLFITCPKGIESLLEEEVLALGANKPKQTVGGLHCQGSLEVIYDLCLWSRLANRVLLKLASGEVKDGPQCYTLCHEYDWVSLFKSDITLSINFSGTNAKIRNEMFGAQTVKDAIVDQLRDQTGIRPNISSIDANCKIHARLRHETLSIYYDLSGHSLHQRGYRKYTGSAPLKENLAAALLYRSGWKNSTNNQKALMDPCCGSGTFLIEAAMIALAKAPGLQCKDFGFMHLKNYDETLWQRIHNKAIAKHEATLKTSQIMIVGYDESQKVLSAARKNIEASGLSDKISIEQCSFKDFKLPNEFEEIKGLLICNPPYGERLNDAPDLLPVYQSLGLAFSEHCQGWQAAVLTSDKVLAKAIGLRSTKQYAFYNGAIACKLYLFELDSSNKSSITTISNHTEMIVNRLKKNLKHLKSWLKQNDIHAYRVYDADMPEYAFAIDIYNDWAHVQEYQAPKEIPLQKTQQRLLDVIKAIPEALNIPRQHIVVKQRKKQKGKQQYQRHDQTQHRLVVKEGKAQLIVNCKDYLDTGLFLDHRLIRRHFFNSIKNKNFLNLFCYTAAVSTHAALGGAKKTVNVDMSRTYLDWAKENFKKNHLNLSKHEFIQADVIKWLDQCKDKFDIIFLDPPSFSNSKRMDKTLDIQRDHPSLIQKTMNLLKPNGELYFSTNFKKFKLNQELFDNFEIKDISKKTIDKDFIRNPTIHRCFILKKK